MNKATIAMIVLSLLSLTACSHMNGQFDCPVSKGVSCQSMKEIDTMASQGYFNSPSVAPRIGLAISLQRPNTLHQQAPLRVEARVLKIWFAPFIDSQDNYHQASEVYTVVDKGFWQGNPVRSIEGVSA